MPIAKERLESLIHVSQSLEDKFIATCNQIGLYIDRFRKGQDSLENTFKNLEDLTFHPELQIEPERRVILTEALWWKHTHKKNERERIRQERRRRADHVPTLRDMSIQREMMRSEGTSGAANILQSNRTLEALGWSMEQIAEYDEQRRREREAEATQQPYVKANPLHNPRIEADSAQDERAKVTLRNKTWREYPIANCPPGHAYIINWFHDYERGTPTRLAFFCQCDLNKMLGESLADWKLHIAQMTIDPLNPPSLVVGEGNTGYIPTPCPEDADAFQIPIADQESETAG